jgi:hypothetical protein
MNLNKTQKKLFDRIIKNKTVFIEELTGMLIGNGIGAIPKREIEVALFYLMNKHAIRNKQYLSNYEWSCLLKINERKVKNLILDMGIRYSSNNDDETELWLAFIRSLSTFHKDVESVTDYVFTIEDPYVLRFIEHKLKYYKKPLPLYNQENTEIVTLKKESLEALFEGCEMEIETESLNIIKKELRKLSLISLASNSFKAFAKVVGNSFTDKVIGNLFDKFKK